MHTQTCSIFLKKNECTLTVCIGPDPVPTLAAIVFVIDVGGNAATQGRTVGAAAESRQAGLFTALELGWCRGLVVGASTLVALLAQAPRQSCALRVHFPVEDLKHLQIWAKCFPVLEHMIRFIISQNLENSKTVVTRSAMSDFWRNISIRSRFSLIMTPMVNILTQKWSIVQFNIFASCHSDHYAHFAPPNQQQSPLTEKN
jgi:hypothetical protein